MCVYTFVYFHCINVDRVHPAETILSVNICMLFALFSYVMSSQAGPGVIARNCENGISQAEVSLSGGPGFPDHLSGADHALLTDPTGRWTEVPGLLCCGGGRAPQNPYVCGTGLQRAQYVYLEQSHSTVLKPVSAFYRSALWFVLQIP